MSSDPAPVEPHTEHHPNRHRLEKFEGMADIGVVVMVVVLGIAMVAGLLTASGNIHL